MGLSRAKFRKLSDLYVKGKVHELTDENGDTVLVWLQVLNQFEVDDARQAAQTARARRIMATKEHDSDRMTRIRSEFVETPRDMVIQQLIERDQGEYLVSAVNSIQRDEEWEERLGIMSRSDEILDREPDDPERALLTDINKQYLNEIRERTDEEREFAKQELERLDEEGLEERWVSAYLDTIGSEAATNEYRIQEMLMAARVCVATKDEDGEWDHASCGGHTLTLWEDRADFKATPDQITEELGQAMADLNMSVAEGKGLGSRPSSSDSHRLPSVEEESEASTPKET